MNRERLRVTLIHDNRVLVVPVILAQHLLDGGISREGSNQLGRLLLKRGLVKGGADKDGLVAHINPS